MLGAIVVGACSESGPSQFHEIDGPKRDSIVEAVHGQGWLHEIPVEGLIAVGLDGCARGGWTGSGARETATRHGLGPNGPKAVLALVDTLCPPADALTDPTKFVVGKIVSTAALNSGDQRSTEAWLEVAHDGCRRGAWYPTVFGVAALALNKGRDP